MDKINILYQSSSAYAIPAAVSICSLLDNNKDIEEIKIWFIDVGLMEEDKKGLKDLVARYGREIIFLSGNATDHMLAEAGVKTWSGSYATFYKIFMCCQLKDIDSILYIDADTLVLGSLKELCNYDIDGYACAMAGSAMTGAIKRYLNLENYFNAGVIYFNLKYWRENNIEKIFLNMINSDECFKYTIVGDESLINYVLKGKIKKMSLKYNYESSWWLWGWNDRLYPKLGWKDMKACYYSKEEIKSAQENLCIAHYVDLTTGRPWDYLNDNLFCKEFDQYIVKLKPWKNIDFAMRGIGGNNKFVAWLKFIIKKLLPFSWRSQIGFWQHEKFWIKKMSELQQIVVE